MARAVAVIGVVAVLVGPVVEAVWSQSPSAAATRTQERNPSSSSVVGAETPAHALRLVDLITRIRSILITKLI